MEMNGSAVSGAPPVIVIGAGASGLPALKCCLEEGLNAVCFEKTSDIGGLWKFREDVTDGLASVMRTTVINSSKEMSSYSDFPPPPELPNFMPHTLQHKYFELYATKFNLWRRIRFQHVVLSVTRRDDFDTSGQWNVLVRNNQTGEEKSLVASAIMVCSGHHSHPHIPKFEGLDGFKGKVIHTHSYKDFRGFEDKRVVVIGIGNSGGDVAVDLSRISSKVYLSTRRGTWVINRVGTVGLPTDYVHLRRFVLGTGTILPASWYQLFATLLHTFRVDHELYNLKPKHKFFEQHPMVNDFLPNCILSGTVVMKSDIERFTENGVVFQGEEDKVYEVDAVILATGYNICFPFMDPRLLTVNENRVHLYKYVFEPKLEHPTLAVIGLIQPLGSVAPIAEMQARWAVRVFSGKQSLPSVLEMEEDISRVRKENENKYVQTQRHTIQVEYMTYMDELGAMIGVKPDLRRLFRSDRFLWLICYLGANVPYQYRLQGPHAWPGARDAILKCGERVRAPLQTRMTLDTENKTMTSSVASLSFLMGPSKPKFLRMCAYLLASLGLVITLLLCL